MDHLATSHHASGPNTKALDKSAISKILKEMDELLKIGNMRGTRMFFSLKEQYGSALGDKLLPLENALDQLDFKRALKESRQLRVELDLP
jgi:hypothetical protein